MPIRLKATFIILGLLALLALVGPFFIPIPELDTVPSVRLTEPDSQFVEVGNDNLQVHYKRQGEGEPHIILLHGFGGSTFSWREVIGELPGTTVAFDRPGFGLTERPVRGEWQTNPYTPAAQIELVVALMDALKFEQAVLVGNSAGGTLAAQVALAHPERVSSLVLADAAVYAGGGAPNWIKPFLNTPQIDRLGPLVARQFGGEPGLDFLRSAYADPARLTDEDLEGYQRWLRAEGWDTALWELIKASRTTSLAPQLSELQVPTLVITGQEDTLVPSEQSEQLAQALPNAEFVSLPGCGHLPQEECPEAFLKAVSSWLRQTEVASSATN